MSKSLHERQVELETATARVAAESYRKDVLKARQKGSGVETFRPETWLMKRALGPFSATYAAFCGENNRGQERYRTLKKFLGKLDPLEVGYIVLRGILNHTTKTQEPIQRLALYIAREVKFHRDFELFRKDNPRLIKAIQARTNLDSVVHRVRVYRANMKRAGFAEFSEDELLSLGLKLLDFLVESTGIIEVQNFAKGGKTFVGVKLSDEVRTWLDRQHGRCELLQVVNPPMLVPPVEWKDNHGGGYLTNFASGRQTLVRTRHSNVQSWLAKPKEVYSAVNSLQATPWRINSQVAEVVEEIVRLGGGVAGLPSFDGKERSTLAKPWGPTKEEFEAFKAEHPEEVRAYCAKAKMLHDDWARSTSKRTSTLLKLQFARKYGKEVQLFFPWFLDWRGRMYPTTGYVNPQADDIGKGLIEFAEGRSLKGNNGVFWLYVHTANNYGVDKVPFTDRVKWVEENIQAILASAKEPLSNRWWVDADSPFKFLQCCFELLRLHEQGLSSFLTHLPVAMDGSCNGLQHYSALLRDSVAGAAVNLVPQEQPGDIYADVAKVVSALVENSLDDEAVWWRGNISRKVVKRNVMTLVYGVTSYGMGDQLHEVVKELGIDCDGHELKAATWLAKKVYDGIGSVAFSAQAGMTWLQECAKLLAETNRPIAWTAPSGFKVFQGYWETRTKRIETIFGGTRIQLGLRADTGTISKRSQANGIAPNFVHSLDAAHCVKTINKCAERGLTGFCMVHDSYGTHASQVETLNASLREAFVEMYSENGCLLSKFKNELEGEYGVTLPPPPSPGSLDITEVLQSRYFFA